MARSAIARLLVVSLLLISGCSEVDLERPRLGDPVPLQAAPPQEPTLVDPAAVSGEITVWGWAPWDAAFAAVLPVFQERYPHVRVKIEMMPQEEVYHRLQAALAMGSGAPDVVGVTRAQLDRLMLQAGLVDLLEGPFYADRYSPYFLPYLWQRATSPDGRLLALPWDAGPGLLYYRRDLFEQAGLPSAPEEVAALIQTWDDYLAVGERIGEIGGALVAHPLEIFQIPFHDAGLFDSNWNLIVERGPAVRYLEVARQIREAELDANLPTWSPEWAEALAGGQIATVFGGPWMPGLLKSWIDKGGTGRWGAIPVPEDPGQHWGGSFLALVEQSSNKTAAWAFMEFALATVDGQNLMMRATEIFPAFRAAYQSPIYDEPDPYFGEQPVRRLLADIAELVTQPVVTPMDSAAEQVLTAVVRTCLEAETPTEECLLTAKQQMEAAISQDRKVALLMRQMLRTSVVPSKIPPSDY